jgi:UDPglucose--hexose-1-phosphate uridylyltransferase
MSVDLQNSSHKRYNILTNEWVLVSPHRTQRPWQGKEEKRENSQQTTYDETCYLCPGNTRANNAINPNYTSTFVFENDFAALQKGTGSSHFQNGLLQAIGEEGICKVICFSPDHSKSLANMSSQEIENVIAVWQDEFEELSKISTINYIQIFENKGAIMGCSNPHPHGQIWSQSSIPNEVLKKTQSQKAYFETHKRSLLADYIQQELQLKERIIFENEHFVVLVPFWAVWPFEAMIVPKQHQTSITACTQKQVTDFATAISKLTRAYDAIFNCSFPYSSGIHQTPTNIEHPYWHWHMSFYPPLLRSATVKKFMVGYEMFGMPQRDITAEKAAEILRSNQN